MSNIVYGSTIIDTTFTCTTGTRAEVVTGVNTVLVANGWTALSGGGTSDVRLKSAVSAEGTYICFRIWDPGSGSSARIALVQTDGTGYTSGQDLYLRSAAGRVYQVLGSELGVVIKPAGMPEVNSYLFVSAVVPHSWQSITGLHGFVLSNHYSEGSTGAMSGQYCLANAMYMRNQGQYYTAASGGITFRAVNVSGIGVLVVLTPGSIFQNTDGSSGYGGAYRYTNNVAKLIEAEVSYSVGGLSTEGKIQGLIPNCCVYGDTVSIDDTTFLDDYDGYSWKCIGTDAGSTASVRGSIFMVRATSP